MFKDNVAVEMPFIGVECDENLATKVDSGHGRIPDVPGVFPAKPAVPRYSHENNHSTDFHNRSVPVGQRRVRANRAHRQSNHPSRADGLFASLTGRGIDEEPTGLS